MSVPTAIALYLCAALTWGCGDEGGLFSVGSSEFRGAACSLDEGQFHDTGVGRDGIPALSDPIMVSPGHPSTGYLLDHHRVIGLRVAGSYMAIPHNILWWHEVVNLNSLTAPLAVTYCPLTGSSLVFDRSAIQGAELGVSGLLLQNNLVMYDRLPGEEQISFWPQMLGEARCGPRNGTRLGRYSAVEMTWGAWRALHPETTVVSGETGFSRDYRRYPYGGYEALENGETLYPQGALDPRRLPKERVLGIPGQEGGGVAFPFLAMDSLGPRAIARVEVAGSPIVVFWDRNAQGATAFRGEVRGRTAEFEVRNGFFQDLETGTVWSLDGLGLAGPLVGERLDPLPHAFVAFWFAWAEFFPHTSIWSP